MLSCAKGNLGTLALELEWARLGTRRALERGERGKAKRGSEARPCLAQKGSQYKGEVECGLGTCALISSVHFNFDVTLTHEPDRFMYYISGTLMVAAGEVGIRVNIWMEPERKDQFLVEKRNLIEEVNQGPRTWRQ